MKIFNSIFGFNQNKIFWITSAAFLIRLIFGLLLDKNAVATDALDWNNLAFDIIHHGKFSSNYRGPVYPLFLALIYSIFGYSVYAVRIIQSILGALTCLTAYYIGKKVFNKNIGILAAGISCIYPYFIYYSADIMSETVLTFLLSLSILILFKWHENINIKNSILYGIIIGITLLCKGTFLPFYMLSLCWMLFAVKHTKFYIKLRSVFVVILFMFITLMPWIIRNYNQYNKFVLLGLGGQSLWLANNPDSIIIEMLPAMNINKLSDNFTWYDAKKYAKILQLPAVEADKWFHDQAVDFIKTNPKIFIELSVRRFFHFWRLYPLIASFQNKIAAILTSGILLPLGWLGILLSFKVYYRKTVFLIMLLISISMIHTIFLSTIRYRVPVDLYMIIFASYTVQEIYKKYKLYQETKNINAADSSF